MPVCKIQTNALTIPDGFENRLAEELANTFCLYREHIYIIIETGVRVVRGGIDDIQFFIEVKSTNNIGPEHNQHHIDVICRQIEEEWDVLINFHHLRKSMIGYEGRMLEDDIDTPPAPTSWFRTVMKPIEVGIGIAIVVIAAVNMPLPNKPGEPDFKLKVEPNDKLNISFKIGEESTIDLKITNTLKERVSFKVKCTDNEIFRVRPPLGFIKAGETSIVKVTLKTKRTPDPTRHFFAIYHMTCTDLKINARLVWGPETKPDGVIRLQAVLEDLEKNDKKDEKTEETKEEDKKEEEKKEEPKKEEPKKEEEKKEEKKEEEKKE